MQDCFAWKQSSIIPIRLLGYATEGSSEKPEAKPVYDVVAIVAFTRCLNGFAGRLASTDP